MGELGDVERDNLTPTALAYVERGESLGHHKRSGCRRHKPYWWSLPIKAAPDCFLQAHIYDAPRVVRNEAQSSNTSILHSVWSREGIDAGWLAAASMNSATRAFSEVLGQPYGDGVLDVTVKVARKLPFPHPRSELPLDELDSLVRRKEVEQALDQVDRIVLAESGLTAAEAATLRRVWRKLSGRRLSR